MGGRAGGWERRMEDRTGARYNVTCKIHELFRNLMPCNQVEIRGLVAHCCYGLEAEPTAKPLILSHVKSRPAVYCPRPWGRRTCLCGLQEQLCPGRHD
jgi:hypothetical protein